MDEKRYADTENTVCLAGVIVDRFEMDRMIRLTLYVPNNTATYRNNNGNTKRVASVPVITVFKNDDNTSMADNYLVHDSIKVTGHFSSNARSLRERDTYKQQQIVADTIEDIGRYYPDKVGDVEGRSFLIFQNHFIVKGEVTQIIQTSQNVKTIDVFTARGKYKNIVRLTVFSPRGDDISIGDFITAQGRVRTARKTGQDGRGRFYQNFVLTYVAKEGDKEASEKAVDPDVPVMEEAVTE